MYPEISAELMVVGSFLLDPSCLQELSKKLRPEDFGTPEAREVYKAALRIEERGGLLEPVTILSEAGGGPGINAYIVEAMNQTPTAANLSVYADLVQQEAQRRRLLSVAERIGQETVFGKEALDIAQKAMDDLKTIQGSKKLPVCGMDSLKNWMQYYHLVKKEPEKAFCATGYSGLDKVLGGGFFRGEMYILAGRPGMGKTTQGIGIAERVAKTGRGVLFASLEMSDTQLTAKRIAITSGVSYTECLSGRLAREEEALTTRAMADLSGRPFYIADDVTKAEEIEQYARGVPELGLVVIDYLGLMQTDERSSSRYEEVTKISAGLKRMAKRLQTPILVLAQLSRENTTRTDKRPMMSDLRDSGAIEQDAGGVILLHRESYYKNQEETPEMEEIELIVAKNRHAAPGTLKMMWHGKTGRITEMDHRSMPF